MPFIKSYIEHEYDGPEDEYEQFVESLPFVYDPHVEGDHAAAADLGADGQRLLDALRAAGATRFRFRYDGGNDEGFSWPRSVRFADGADVPTRDVAGRLPIDWDAPVPLPAPQKRSWFGFGKATPAPLPHPSPSVLPQDRLKYAFEALAEAAASTIAGRGFGTGEYELYGEGTLDLRTLEVTDDPHAPRPEQPPGFSSDE